MFRYMIQCRKAKNPISASDKKETKRQWVILVKK